MGGSWTRDRVAEALDTLNSTYDSFPVHQSSVSVDRETYERLLRRCERGVIDAGVRVHHDDRLLVLDSHGEARTPHGIIEAGDASIETGARRLVRDLTGVTCHVVDLVIADIVGIHDTTTPDCKPIYRLSALFEAAYETGELRECASWNTSVPPVTPIPK